MSKSPQCRIDYIPDWRDVPMAYWVHVQSGDGHWRNAIDYLPAAPKPHGKKGFPVLCVDIAGMTFRFSSRAQLLECIRVLSCKPLPSSKKLSALRGTGLGPNSHWLSRLPANVKSAKGRQRVVGKLSPLADVLTDP